MRYLTFDEVRHQGHGRYAIDWDTNSELKYKEPMNGIRVYESGVIVVHRNGYRDPAWRYDAKAKFDLNFVLTKDLTHVTFVAPDTGVTVPDILLHDTKLGRVYNLPHWQYSDALRFVSPDAQPMGGLPMTYYAPNVQRTAERTAVFEPMFELGRTLRALNNDTEVLDYFQMTWRIGWDAKRTLQGETPLPLSLSLEDEETQKVCVTLAQCESYARKLIFLGARDKYEPNYLLIKEK